MGTTAIITMMNLDLILFILWLRNKLKTAQNTLMARVLLPSKSLKLTPRGAQPIQTLTKEALSLRWTLKSLIRVAQLTQTLTREVLLPNLAPLHILLLKRS